MVKDNRKIAAILAADVVEYSRLMGADEKGTVAALKIRRAVFDQLVKEFDGREFGSVGDSLMAEFPSAVNAVRCAQAIQLSIAAENEPLPAERRMSLRIGVNLGDVIEEQGALFGDGVNVAARLQSLATPGGVLISGAVYEQVRNKIAARFIDAGPRQVKNITEPVRVYEVAAPVVATLAQKIAALLRRRVFIAGAIYGLASTLFVWALSRFVGATVAAAWLVPASITLLAAAFVPAMTVVWQSDRRHRTAPWIGFAAASIVTVLCCAIVWSAWTGYFDQRAQAAITRSTPKAQPVVAVAALQNLTGDPKLEWLSEGVASLVRDGLAESSHLIVVSPTRWQAVLRNHESETVVGADVLTSAARAGIDYVVSGEFLSVSEGLLLTARLSDVNSGVEVDAHRTPNLTAQTLLGEAARLVLMAKRGLGVPHTESVASFSADFAVNNMAAYEAYLGGIGYFLKFDYHSAERSFRAALELAPDFHMARYRLAHVQVASGDLEGGLATLDEIPGDAPLTRRERYYVDGANALFAEDAVHAKEIYKAILREFPFDVEAQWLLVLTHDVAYEDAAAIQRLQLLLKQEPENDYLWSYLGETYLRLGEYAQARQALDRYLVLKPRDPFGFSVLGQLAQLSNELDNAAGYFERALVLDPEFEPARLGLAQTEALRGRWPEAEHLLRALIADQDAASFQRIDAAFSLSSILRAQGEFVASLTPLEQLSEEIHKERLREEMSLAERGLTQAELGNIVEARRLIDLATASSPGVPTRFLFARAMVDLKLGKAAGMRSAAAEIREFVSPGKGPQGTAVEEAAHKASAYLDGMASFVDGDFNRASATLSQAVALPGYQYSIYRLGLARSLFAEGKNAEALELARAARTERDAGDIRLDLELDRSRALLLEAEVLAKLGDASGSKTRARTFLKRWRNTRPDQPDRVLAELLANAGK